MPKKILKGFTLIELLVVVAIIGILSAIGVVAYSKYSSMAQTKAIEAQNNEIYNFRRIRLAPLMVVSGFILCIFSILYKDKK